ncbi:MAG TPA: tetratricopeptide repeat protein [Gemmatimonadaceae bacterium]|nr:tetratricopeptide repeat protein [Gemmatimonadaceae bacterium]
MASTARIDELKKKFDENPRRYFAPLANEFRKAGDIEQAIMICEEFLPQQPGHMSGHIVYGQALFEGSRFEESRTVFETALTLDPENLIALRHLGDIARGQGDLEAARRWYDRVLEADPRNDEIQGLIVGLANAPAAEIPAAPPPLPEPMDLDMVDAPELRASASVAEPPALPQPKAPVARAEGLESVEFTPPAGPVDGAHDLGGTVESGEFTAPASHIEPLAGLEETSMGAFERNVPDGGPDLPMLDTSEPDAGSSRAIASDDIPDVGPSTLEFTVPTAAERAAVRGRAATSTMPELEPEGSSLPDTQSGSRAGREYEAPTDIPPELPPAVIAAEAELMDLGEPIPSGTDVADPPLPPATALPAPAPQAPFVTETMAELFLRQGFRDQARDVYGQLLAANPHDERLRQRVAELEPAPPAAAGDSVRDFLARIATRRPGERTVAAAPPSDDDFADASGPAGEVAASGYEEAPPEMAPPGMASAGAQASRPTPSSVMSTGIERGAATQGAGGSIDALFGNRAVGTSEDSAASALAQAFGSASEPAPGITGRPARAAAGELSLDSVFRDGPQRPPRASQTFSFDQFFSPESASPDRTVASPATQAGDPSSASEPAERSADDIEQFNSWLQGLKPK